ncbi:MAG: ATP-binding protein [Thermoproteota archaeon]
MKDALEILNPWWFGEKDNDLGKWEKQKVKWVPKWIEHISLKPFSLNFIVGPRQVGKTTGIKLLIKSLIEKGIEKEKIIYLNAELIPEIGKFEKTLISISRKNFDFIFIDEVTSLENWWMPLKGLIDAGCFKKSSLTVSGSISLKLRKQAELFPGRTGSGKVVEVMPLSFRELVEVLKVGEKTSRIREAFEIYKKYGGFPASLNYFENFYGEWVKAFESDILKIGLSLKTSYQILSSLLTKLPSPVSYQSIASDIGVSYKTVSEYLEKFENLFVMKLVYWKEGKRIDFKKEKKIFFRDPLILHAISFWTKEKFLDATLYENIVQEHLFRRFGEVYYYRDGFEIDCLADELKIEVKAGKPHRKYPRNVIILEEEDIPEFLLKLENFPK